MVNKLSHARGARGLLEYLQDPDRTYQADSTKLVSMTGRTEGDATEGDEEKKSFWYKKKYWILAISVISLLFFALTLSLSLYFGLYYGNHATKGDYSKVLKVKKFSFIYVYVYAYKQF